MENRQTSSDILKLVASINVSLELLHKSQQRLEAQIGTLKKGQSSLKEYIDFRCDEIIETLSTSIADAVGEHSTN